MCLLGMLNIDVRRHMLTAIYLCLRLLGMLNIDVRRHVNGDISLSTSLLGMLNIDVRRQILKKIMKIYMFARYVEYRC